MKDEFRIMSGLLPVKAVFSSIVLWLLVSFCFGRLIQSTIYSETGNPVEDVAISDGYHRVFSWGDGRFGIETQADSIYISKLGWKKQVLHCNKIPQPIILQSQDIMLPPVTVIGKFADIGAQALDANVIYQDTDSKPTSVAEALAGSSSLASSDVALAGERQTYSILGNLNRHTVIMLDDVVLNPGGAAYDLSSLQMENIGRIEIIKGNASLYGGANAIGGIVKFYRKDSLRKSGLTAESETAAGAFGLWKSRYLLAYHNQGRRIRVEYNGYTADNDFPYRPRPWWHLPGKYYRLHNAKRSDAVTISVGVDKQRLSIDYTLGGENYSRQLPGPVNFLPLYDQAELTGLKLNNTFKLRYLQGKFSETLTAWLNADNSEYRNEHSTSPVYPSNNQHYEQQTGIKSQTSFSYRQYKIDISQEVSRQSFSYTDRLSLSQTIPLQKRLAQALSLRVEDRFDFSWGEYVLAAGLRQDKAGAFEPFDSWRIEQQIKLQTLADIQLGHSIGTSFALPSFYDLYWKGDTQSMGNPELKPETSRGQSIWSSVAYGQFSCRVALSANSINDLIQWRQVYLFGTVWKPVNISEARIVSKELELTYSPLRELTISGSATSVLALDKSFHGDGSLSPSYNKRLVYTPDLRYSGRVAYHHSYAGADVSVHYTGKQYTTTDNVFTPLPEVNICNASAYAKLNLRRLKVQANLKLNNLFDKQYEVYAYVPQPGFGWQCSLDVSYEK